MQGRLLESCPARSRACSSRYHLCQCASASSTSKSRSRRASSLQASSGSQHSCCSSYIWPSECKRLQQQLEKLLLNSGSVRFCPNDLEVEVAQSQLPATPHRSESAEAEELAAPRWLCARTCVCVHACGGARANSTQARSFVAARQCAAGRFSKSAAVCPHTAVQCADRMRLTSGG